MKKILIYLTDGICKYSANNTKRILQYHFKKDVVLDSNLNNLKEFNILCVPGGIGSNIIKKIKKNDNQIINFIEEGGTYLGICCGAYLASNIIKFENKSVSGLNLINVDSIGPVYKKNYNEIFNINNIDNIINVPITDIYNKQLYYSYLHGGGYFNINKMNIIKNTSDRYYYKNNPNISNTMLIEAEYNDKKPCIISYKRKNGVVILSHVHPEHQSSNLFYTFNRIFQSYNLI
jgi:glutamine amidotransferase-like uncharacterized protein